MSLTAAPIPQLHFFAEAAVQVGAPIEVGRGPRGLRRMIPILGGEARGEGWNGRILPGGADYQLIVGDTLAELQAHYVIETDAGDLVYVRNQAIRSASAEVTAKLVKGEPVDPSLVYFRCAPSLETGSKALAWINERLFVGTGVRRPSQVEVAFYLLD